MSSPPQLHLTLPSNTTSFKRSFEQFGFDLESPVGGPEAGSSGSGSNERSDNGRNSRNKRARSTSTLSDGNDSMRSSTSSSTFTSGSSDTSFSEGSSGHGSSGNSVVVSTISPPRIPTPDIQDIEMPDYQQEDLHPRVSSTVSSDENYRLSLDRLNSMESRIAALRRSSSLPRSSTPPPTLPPLQLEEDSTPPVPFLSPTTQLSSPIPDHIYSSRLTADAPPRLPSPVQRSPPLSEPLYDLGSEPFNSASHVDPLVDHTSQTPSSGIAPSNVVDLRVDDREPFFAERLNAALDTGDITSFRERVSSALDAFRNSINRAYDDLGESSSSSATARPHSSASSAPSRRSASRPATVLSVTIPNSSILSPSSPSSPAIPSTSVVGTSQNSGFTSEDSGSSAAEAIVLSSSRRPPSQDIRLSYRGLSLFENNLDRTSAGPNSARPETELLSSSSAPSLPFSSSRLSPIHFLDPLWDTGTGDNPVGTAAGGSLSNMNVSASSSTTERSPYQWRQLHRTNSQPEHRHRSRQASGVRRQSSFSRDLARWFEDSSSDADAGSGPSRTHADPIEIHDPSEAEDDDRPIIPRPIIPGLPDIYLGPDLSTNSSATTTISNASTRNVRHSMNSTETPENTFETFRTRRFVEQEFMDPVRRPLGERSRRQVHEIEEADAAEAEVELDRIRRRLQEYDTEVRQRGADNWQFFRSDPFGRARERARERREREFRLDIETDLGGWGSMDVDHDDQPRDDTDSGQELSESERIYQQSRRMRLTGSRNPGSLFRAESAPSERRGSARTFNFQLPPSSLSSSLAPGLHHTRSRIHGPRPGASNSLLTENAAEIRRRNARAELIEHLSPYSSRMFSTPTGEPSASSTSVSLSGVTNTRRSGMPRNDTNASSRTMSRSPILPPLPYQYRSPSPPTLPRAIVEVLDSVDRETQNQERSDDDSSQRWSANVRPWWWRSGNQSPMLDGQNGGDSEWLPSSQSMLDGSTRVLDSEMDGDGHTESSIRTARQTLRRVGELSRGALSLRRVMSSRSPTRDDLSQTHNHSSSWSHSNRTRSRQRQESTGFFDSQSSTISDIVRTISTNGDLFESERRTSDESDRLSFLPSSEDRNSWRSSNDLHSPTSPPPRRHRSMSNPPPSIPPPDLGDVFVPGGLSEDSPLGSRNDLLSSSHSPVALAPPERSGPQSSNHHGPSSNPLAGARASSERGVIDVESFAPGPFRNTMQRLVEQGRLRNSRPHVPPLIPPPLIPPLTFEDDFEVLRRAIPGPLAPRVPEAQESRIPRPSHVHRSNTSASRPHISSRESTTNLNRRPSLPSSVRSIPTFTRRSSAEEMDSNRNLSRRRLPDDLHRVIMNHARMDASLLHSPDMPPRSAPGESEGFNHAIEVLRHDGLSDARSQQLIERYHRERDGNAPSPSSSLWGALEDNSSTHSHPTFRPWRSRSNTPGSSAATTGTDTFAGTRSRRLSPTRTLDRPENSQDRLHRPRMLFGLRRNPVSFGEDVFLSEMVFPRRHRGNFTFGDFMRDEDFDESYESLSLLGATLGDVKPRGTPEHVIAGLETAFYKDWATEDSDKRCPICLDDYKPLDSVLKLKECSHWLHKQCLEQWLKGAATCPVCRESVVRSPSIPSASISSSSTHPRPTADPAPLRWNFHRLRSGRHPLDLSGASRNRQNTPNSNNTTGSTSTSSSSNSAGLRINSISNPNSSNTSGSSNRDNEEESRSQSGNHTADESENFRTWRFMP